MLCCLTLDDFNSECLDRRATEVLDWLVFYFPKFKVNLLVSGNLSIPINKHPDNFAYLLHGWDHLHEEILTDKQLQSWKYDRIYKSPYWELTDVMYKRLIDNNYKVLLMPDDKREGIKHNWDIRYPPDLNNQFLFGQGHVTNNLNYIADKVDNILMLPRDTEFLFVRDL